MKTSPQDHPIIACCGLVCTDCLAYQATQADDPASIAEIAKQWTKQFGVDVTPEHVWCDGCITGGRKCGHCGECEIRACALAKPLANCGHCASLADCSKIQAFFNMVPAAKDVLAAVARGLV